MIIDCALYRDGRRQQEAALTLEEAASLHGDGSQGFAWLGTLEPGSDELEEIRDASGCTSWRSRTSRRSTCAPRSSSYGGLRRARHPAHGPIRRRARGGRLRRDQRLRRAPTFVITVRQGVASELHSARHNLEAHPELLAQGSAAVLWAILDQVVNGYGPVVAELERDIEEVESTVFAGWSAPTERIYFLRREVTNFYRAVHPLLPS